MRSIGSLMAEQADKVPRDSEEDKNLFNCSRTIHALDEFFEKCGHFDYRDFEPLLDQEALQILNQYPPVKKL